MESSSSVDTQPMSMECMPDNQIQNSSEVTADPNMQESCTDKDGGSSTPNDNNISRDNKMKAHREKCDKIVIYLTTGKYPPGLTKNQQRVVRGQAKVYAWDETKKELYYTGGKEGVNRRVIMTVEEIADILKQHHSDPMGGHSGINSTLAKVATLYYWHCMKEDIKEYIEICDRCQRCIKIKTQAPERIPIKVEEPLELVGMDLIRCYVMALNPTSDVVEQQNTCYRHLLHTVTLQDTARQWLKEDTPNFDYGGFVIGEKQETAILLCKSEGVLAGTPFFDAIFKELDCEVKWFKYEGEQLKPICRIATVTGKVRHILLGERVALNVLCRTSGIATFARRLKTLGQQSGWHGSVAGTRKTTPGFRLAEKYALLVGGISAHRFDLSSMIMLKDNHIWSAGNITRAVQDARQVGGFSIKIEVECRTIEDACQAVEAGADVVMLDNFEPKALHLTAETLKQKYPHVIVESSGGVTESTITSYMGKYVDVISLSRTTQGYDVVDFSLKIQKEGHNPENPMVTNIH